MPPLDLETLRSLDTPLRLPHKCPLRHCSNPTVYRGQLCASCEAAIEKERQFLRLKKEAKG